VSGRSLGDQSRSGPDLVELEQDAAIEELRLRLDGLERGIDLEEGEVQDLNRRMDALEQR